MDLTRSAGWFAGAMGCLALAGCLGTEDGAADDAINTAPASLTEANAEMDKIDRIMAERGSTATLVEAQRLVRDRLDVLSGLVDRIDVAPDHSINFFVSSTGEIMVDERMKVGDVSAMKRSSAESFREIYARLAPGRTIPAAIADVPALPTSGLTTAPGQAGAGLLTPADVLAATAGADGTASVRSALTDSPADDQYFRDNYCSIQPGGTIVFQGPCVIDKVGNRYVQATADHAQLSVAMTVGTSINLRRRASVDGAVEQDIKILVGEEHWLAWWGPWIEVRDSGCLPWPFACGTHREAQQRFKRWTIENASSSEKYDMSSVHYNMPLIWNGW